MNLLISETFLSIQGESSMAGRPCVFIRLAGCGFSCSYCDTLHAKKGGRSMSISAITTAIKRWPVRYACVTGGEPLEQPAVHALIKNLLAKRYEISLETNGCLDISGVDRRVHVIMDIKAPSSGMSGRNMRANLKYLKKNDDIIIVISGRSDYNWFKKLLDSEKLLKGKNVFLSPASGRLKPSLLASWLIRDGLPVRLQLQLHKIIGLK